MIGSEDCFFCVSKAKEISKLKETIKFWKAEYLALYNSADEIDPMSACDIELMVEKAQQQD